MAKMILTSDWQTLPVTKGCIQNNSGVSVEVSETNTDNSGQILKSGEALDFENITLYARCTVKNKTSEVRVSPFVTAGGSGSGGSSGGGGTTYILPTASKTIKGGIIVGNNLDINASGVLSATDTTYPQADGLNSGVAKLYSAAGTNTDGAVTQKLFTSELNKKVDGTSLGTAATHDTGTRVGDVVIVGASGTIDNSLLPAIAINDVHPANSEAAMLALSAHKGDVCIRSDERKSYILAANPATVKNNWVYLESPSGDVVSVNGKTGVVTIDVDKWNSVELNKTADSAPTAYIPFLLTTSANSAKLAKGTVTAEQDTFVIRDNDGSIKAKMPAGTVSDDTLINKKYYNDNMPEGYTLPTASAATLGGIKVGENLSINDEGVLSSNPGSYTLPAASATELGGVKVGSNLTIDGNGVLSADDQTASLADVAKSGSYNDLTDTPATYVLPTASKTVKGGILVGDNLDIDSDGKLKANHEPVVMGADTTSTASPKAGEIFTVIDGVTKDGNGHVTAVNTKTVTLPAEPVVPTVPTKVSELENDSGFVSGEYLPVTGGELKGNTISRNVDDKNIAILGGKSWDNSAHLELRGMDNSSGVYFNLGFNQTGKGSVDLIGKPDGTLTWNNKKIPVSGEYVPVTGGVVTGVINKRTGVNDNDVLTATYYDNTQGIITKDSKAIFYQQYSETASGVRTLLQRVMAKGTVPTDGKYAYLDMVAQEDKRYVVTNNPAANSNSNQIATTSWVQSKIRTENLIPYPYDAADDCEEAGITYHVNDDGSITANGTATKTSYFQQLYGYSDIYGTPRSIGLEVGKKYTLTLKVENGTASIFIANGISGKGNVDIAALRNITNKQTSQTFTYTQGTGWSCDVVGLYIAPSYGNLENCKIWFWLEEGEVAHEYSAPWKSKHVISRYLDYLKPSPVVTIPSENITDYKTGQIAYCIRNGICYVSIANLTLTTQKDGTRVTASLTGLPTPIETLPLIDCTLEVYGEVVGNIYRFAKGKWIIQFSSTGCGHCSFSYPVR